MDKEITFDYGSGSFVGPLSLDNLQRLADEVACRCGKPIVAIVGNIKMRRAYLLLINGLMPDGLSMEDMPFAARYDAPDDTLSATTTLEGISRTPALGFMHYADSRV